MTDLAVSILVVNPLQASMETAKSVMILALHMLDEVADVYPWPRPPIAYLDQQRGTASTSVAIG